MPPAFHTDVKFSGHTHISTLSDCHGYRYTVPATLTQGEPNASLITLFDYDVIEESHEELA